jgi:hypothetical protein
MEGIKNNQPIKFPEEPYRPQEIKSLIQGMLTFDEQNRLSWEEIFNNKIIYNSP